MCFQSLDESERITHCVWRIIVLPLRSAAATAGTKKLAARTEVIRYQKLCLAPLTSATHFRSTVPGQRKQNGDTPSTHESNGRLLSAQVHTKCKCRSRERHLHLCLCVYRSLPSLSLRFALVARYTSKFRLCTATDPCPLHLSTLCCLPWCSIFGGRHKRKRGGGQTWRSPTAKDHQLRLKGSASKAQQRRVMAPTHLTHMQATSARTARSSTPASRERKHQHRKGLHQGQKRIHGSHDPRPKIMPTQSSTSSQ